MSKIGRNEPCPCGSGLKYKQCCEGHEGQPGWGMRLMGWLVIAVLAAGALLVMFSSFDQPGRSTQMVWSEEHGHYHEVP